MVQCNNNTIEIEKFFYYTHGYSNSSQCLMPYPENFVDYSVKSTLGII